jgi:hypothetical protein
MKFIEFECDLDTIKENQARLSDSMRQAVYEENASLFERLDFDNDFIFLEPTLFCYFLSELPKKDKISLEQSLFGYMNPMQQPTVINIKSDLFGIANIPNVGHLMLPENNQVELTADEIIKNKVNDTYVNGKIRLCSHPTDHLAMRNNTIFNEPIQTTLSKHKTVFDQAVDFFVQQLPDLWATISAVTREFVLFSSPNHNSFAAISHHGTAYLNTENRVQSLPFFIEDIAHQCGHIVFNSLTLDTESYLRVSKDYPLSAFINDKSDNRNVYGAFHGLFTYTTILTSMDKLYQSKVAEQVKIEALARLGFFYRKFEDDLSNLNNKLIFTELGLDFHNQFKRGFDRISELYADKINDFDYSNQPYTFRFDLFEDLNHKKNIQ